MAVVLIQFILAFQGIDVCDDGFALTFYQQFFNDADSVEYNFVYWLSGLVGGLWYELYPDGGVLWFRILALLINTLIFSITYRLLRPYVNKGLLLTCLVMVLFVNNFGFLVFYNNNITALLSVSAVYALNKGLAKNSTKWVIISGVIVGMNIFSRIPNLSQVVLVMGIPAYFFFSSKKINRSLKPSLKFILGVVLGIFFVVLLLLTLGQLEIMKRAVSSLFDIGKTERSSHNVLEMFHIYWGNYKKVLKYGSVALLSFLLLLFVRRHLVTRKYTKIVFGFVVGFMSYIWWQYTGIYGYYALAYLGVIYVLTKSSSLELRTLAFAAFLVQFFLPFGSGGGLRSIGYMSIWLSFPFVAFILQDMVFGSKEGAINYVTKSQRLITLMLLLIFIGYKLQAFSQGAYFDPGSRFLMTAPINNSRAQWVFTHPDRADIINKAVNALENHAEPGDYVLAYDKIPMLHFLTETKPYMYNSWPWIYDQVTFEKKLRAAEENRDRLPIVIQQKFETIGRFSKPNLQYLSNDIEETYLHNNKISEVFISYLNRYDYKMVWSNSHFNIYKPKNTK